VIGSVMHQGCLFERGPNSTLDTHPVIAELLAQLGLSGRQRWAAAAADKRYVVRDGVLTALPTTPAAFLSTGLFSWRAKLALLREPFVPASPPAVEESIAAFVRRRLGTEFLEYAIDPFVAGIYAGDPEAISVPAAFPKLHALEQRWGSLIRGQVLGAAQRRRQGEVAKNAARSFSFDGGMQVLTDALASVVGPVALQTRAVRIERDGNGLFTLHADRLGVPVAWCARTLLLATPAESSAGLLHTLLPDAAAALASIPYAPVATVASSYAASDIDHALDGFGCLVPRKEQRRVLGVLFSSSMYAARAPAGMALLTSFVGGRRQPELPGLPDEQIAALVQAEHRALLGAREAPAFQWVTRWPRAIPQYTLGHLDRVARADAASRAMPGLFLCASWKGGVAVGDCIRNGLLEAEAMARWLRVAA
jgi:oxygen-dependent protoporphyrinogen oxidase